MTELETYLSEALYQISNSNVTQAQLGLKSLDSLFGRLCILANPNKSYNRSSSSLRPDSAVSQHSQVSVSTISTGTTTTSNNSSSSSSSEIQSNSISSSSSTGYKRRWKIPTQTDPIFGEFVKLQDSFQFNITSNLIDLLSRIHYHHLVDDELVQLILKVLQGCLLLHPSSRTLFQREQNMKLLIDYLNAVTSSSILINLIPTFVSCLVRNVGNLRTFESLEGPKKMCNLLTHKPKAKSSNWKQVQVKVLEFLFFYLIPESKSQGTQKDGYIRKTMQDKKKILNEYLNNDITEGLVSELLESKPFGNMNTEW